MKTLILLLVFSLLLSCSSISLPNDFVGSFKFEGNIIDLEKENINSKEELFTRYLHSDKLIFSYENEDKYRYKFVAYVNPLCNNKPVLDNNFYKSGMPVLVSVKRDNMVSEQPVVLIKGCPEWADSSYEYNGENFTILPVCDGKEREISELRFTYAVEKSGKIK
jgi:hypothetical protein